MNKPIRRVSVFCLVLVLALLIRVNWVQGVDAGALNSNTHNARVAIEAYSHPRGRIIVGGQAVTGSVLVNGNKYTYVDSFPQGPMYAPVTGYSSALFGSSLLEGVEDPLLSGKDPRLAADSVEALLTGKPKQGGDVVTTIDPRVQAAAYKAFVSGGKTGAAVAVDPQTGAILALVSAPSYDPGVFASGGTASGPAYTKLLHDPANPMLNRALRQTYPPGSTFKLVTAAAALETGVVTDIHAATDTPDPLPLPESTTPLSNEDNDPCRNASMIDALAVSCNTVFAKFGDQVGNARMAQEADKFGFNNPTLNIPVRVDASVFDSGINRPSNMLSSIGQYDTRATPLEMAMVAAAICNNGSLMQPYLVAEERAADKSVISRTQPKQLSQATTPAVAAQIQTMMVDVVQQGTGTTAQIPGVTVGGKTGTAQHGVNNAGNPYAWFVSYAKAPNGKDIAVAVVVEASDTQRSEISGSGLAAPIAKQMMSTYLAG